MSSWLMGQRKLGGGSRMVLPRVDKLDVAVAANGNVSV